MWAITFSIPPSIHLNLLWRGGSKHLVNVVTPAFAPILQCQKVDLHFLLSWHFLKHSLEDHVTPPNTQTHTHTHTHTYSLTQS